jgi:hypothetical protein
MPNKIKSAVKRKGAVTCTACNERLVIEECKVDVFEGGFQITQGNFEETHYYPTPKDIKGGLR